MLCGGRELLALVNPNLGYCNCLVRLCPSAVFRANVEPHDPGVCEPTHPVSPRCSQRVTRLGAEEQNEIAIMYKKDVIKDVVRFKSEIEFNFGVVFLRPETRLLEPRFTV